MYIRFISFILILVLVSIPAVHAQDELSLTVAAGAGYRRLVDEISMAYTSNSGVTVNKVFGNMGQIITQAQESGAIDFIIGDKQFLDATRLIFTQELTIGKGKLVAAVAKGVKIHNIDDFTGTTVKRIAIADSKKAIYGHAAAEFCNNKGIWQQIQPKLLMVGTVPQVTAYLLTGEVDVGFINLTEALAIKERVELLIPIDEKLYSPILILAKRLQRSKHTEVADSYVAFLRSEEAQAMFRKQGL